MKKIYFAVLMGLLLSQICSQTLLKTEKKIVDYLKSNTENAITLLEKVVNINSDTMNLEGVHKVGALFEKEFSAIGFDTKWLKMPKNMNRAGHLFAVRKGNKGKRLLLIGHLDTVFPKTSSFQKFKRQGDHAWGPGTNDMKGGIVAMLYALKALYSVGALKDTQITVALMGDEEKMGKPLSLSRGELIATAKQSDIALGFEYAVDTINKVTIARRGIVGWSLKVTGKSGHSSQIFGEKYGNGAIYTLTKILSGFHDQLKGEKYLTFNPGIVLGGTIVDYNSELSTGKAFGKMNVIAKIATASGDLRFISAQQQKRAMNRMRQIVAQNTLPGTTAKIIFLPDSYPAMAPTEGNKKLLSILNKVNINLGYGPIEALDPGKRGAADTSFVAPHVPMVMDGLGLLGQGAHTNQEYIDLSALGKIMERSALLIYQLTQK